jgi:hypothetical protein
MAFTTDIAESSFRYTQGSTITMFADPAAYGRPVDVHLQIGEDREHRQVVPDDLLDAVAPRSGHRCGAARERAGRVRARASVEQRKTHEQVGTELGYRYELSPLICAESDTWMPDVREVYIPTARPGARLPHARLADGGALHDRFGDGYTLLRLRQGAGDTSAFDRSMRSFGAPFQVVEFDEEPLRAIYRRDLLLLRPDLHVCWRGDLPPTDPRAVAAIVTGHRVSAAWAESDNRKENEEAVDTQPVFNW